MESLIVLAIIAFIGLVVVGMVVMFFGTIAGVVGIFFVNKKNNEKAQNVWSEVGAQRGLRFAPSSLTKGSSLSGTVEGVPIQVKVLQRRGRGRTGYSSHSNNTLVMHTQFVASLSGPWIARVQITKRGATDGLANLLGGGNLLMDGEDIPLGDHRFDEQFRIRGALGEELRARLLDEQVQMWIRRLSNEYFYFQIRDGNLEVQVRGRIEGPAELEGNIDTVVEAAQMIRGDTPAEMETAAETPQW